MIVFKGEKMHKDILKRLNEINKPQRHLPERLGVKRSTLHRLGKGKEIKLTTLLKLLDWLNVDANIYIVDTRGKNKYQKSI